MVHCNAVGQQALIAVIKLKLQGLICLILLYILQIFSIRKIIEHAAKAVKHLRDSKLASIQGIGFCGWHNSFLQLVFSMTVQGITCRHPLTDCCVSRLLVSEPPHL